MCAHELTNKSTGAPVDPHITFGMIVLNGEPFLRYNLEALYPFASQIIVVEGACPASAAYATPDGHSIDRTLDVLAEFRRNQDPEGKVVVVTAEDEGHPSGFWPGEKDEQSRAYANRASGNWLWQVDVDEFYQPEDVKAIIGELAASSAPDTVSFEQLQFWGDAETLVDGWYLRAGGSEFHRLFRWSEGSSYTVHRPPTVVDPDGHNLRTKRWLRGKTLARRGIYLYHYSLVIPSQVARKSAYYAAAHWSQLIEMRRWYDEAYLTLSRPYRVHNVYRYPSWLEAFRGHHPPVVRRMLDDVSSIGALPNHSLKIRALLMSRRYRTGVAALKLLAPIALGSERIAVAVYLRIPNKLKLYVRRVLRPLAARLLPGF